MADENRITVTVNAGEHNRDGCPVSVDMDNSETQALAGGSVTLTDQASGAVIPADLNSDGKTATLLMDLGWAQSPSGTIIYPLIRGGWKWRRCVQ